MELRQIIVNLSYAGAITNTTVVEFDGPDKNLPPRNATPEDLALIGDATSAGYLARIATLEADAATLDDLRAALAASQATLAEHQAISDQLVVAARAAIAANDVEALGEILHQAGLFGSAREADRIDLKTAALQAELDALAAAKAALPSLLAY